MNILVGYYLFTISLPVKMFNKINEADKTMQELEDEFRIGPSKGILGKFKDYF